MPTQMTQELADDFMRENGEQIRYRIDEGGNAHFVVGHHRMELRDARKMIEGYLWRRSDLAHPPQYLDEFCSIVFERIRAQST